MKRVTAVEDVWLCRLCGHMEVADVIVSRCRACGTFTRLDHLPRVEAERLARRQRRRAWWRWVVLRLAILVLLGGAIDRGLRIVFDLSLYNPPRATTRISASLAPHSWPQVRRTPQNTGFTPDAVPFPHQVRWRYRTSKPLHASPAVVDQHVYLTTEDGRVVALDRLTGQQVWAYRTGWLSASTPAVAGAWVIVAIRPGRVMALDRHTGTRRWEVDLEQPIMASTSPIVGNGSVYIGAADGKLHALDVATGRRRWAFATKDWILSTAAYTGRRVIVASQDTRIYAIGARSGRLRFVYPTGRGQHAGAGMAIAGSLAYFGSSGGRVSAMAWESITYPFDLLVQRWKGRLFLWGVIKQVPEQKGRVWSTRVSGDVVHIPAVAQQSVYVSTYQGDVIALDAATGVIRWATGVQTRATSAPTVAGRQVLVGTEDGVVGLDVESGVLQWRFKTHGRVTGSPIVAGDTMYVASHDGILYAVTASQ